MKRQERWNGSLKGWNFKLQSADAGKVGLEEAIIAIVSGITWSPWGSWRKPIRDRPAYPASKINRPSLVDWFSLALIHGVRKPLLIPHWYLFTDLSLLCSLPLPPQPPWKS